jgi:glutaredoxin
MPNDCPQCCRALEEIERMVLQIEEITAKHLSSGEQRQAMEKVVKRIVNLRTYP